MLFEGQASEALSRVRQPSGCRGRALSSGGDHGERKRPIIGGVGRDDYC